MEDTKSTWRGLPVEILLKIFRFADGRRSKSKPHNLALVCKTWTVPVQTELYSEVEIHNLSQLRKFSNTVERNLYLGRLVKKFTYSIYRGLPNVDKEEKVNLMTSLLSNCLPNLELLYTNALYSYFPLLDALQDSRLRHLKIINAPMNNMEKCELVIYATCILLLKGRIEEIHLSEAKSRPDIDTASEVTNIKHLYFNRLYSRVGQFEKLRSLDIDKKTNDGIQEIEYILANCKSLKSLTFEFDQPGEEDDSTLQNKTTSIEAITTFTPTLDMKEVACTAEVSDDYCILLYVMHKFLQLQKMTFRVKGENFALLDQNILKQLLNYLSKIDNIDVGDFCVDGYRITDTIGEYWSMTSKPGKECLEVIYSPKFAEGEQCFLHIWKDENTKQSTFTINYPSFTRDIQLNSFMEKNGIYIGRYEFGASGSKKYLLPSNFVSQTFKQCPNIRFLEISYCILKHYTHSGMDLRNKPLLEELYFYECLFYPGVLERLSMSFSKIKLLRIGGLLNDDDLISQPPGLGIPPDDPELEILMPNTSIDCISIENIYDGILYVKVFAENDGDYHYYKYRERKLKKSEEWEFTEVNIHAHIYICCKTNPTLKIC